MPESSALYPLKFRPIFKEKIWGGERISKLLKKPSGKQCGESWEVSTIPNSISIVSEGDLAGKTLQSLIQDYGEQLLGTTAIAFPLLIKFIDANADLSIQVHPNDEQSNGQGKAEMWYVIEADEGATLLCGFKALVTLDTVRKSIENGNFHLLLNRIPVKSGDVFFIPPGTVHTIGEGILLAEIQQSSDVTYRIFDFDRENEVGNKRELHLEEALGVMNIATYNGKVETSSNELVKCPHFNTKRIKINETISYEAGDRFKAFINVSGRAKINFGPNSWSLNFGETCLLPAGLQMEIEPEGEVILLETYVGDGGQK